MGKGNFVGHAKEEVEGLPACRQAGFGLRPRNDGWRALGRYNQSQFRELTYSSNPAKISSRN